MHNVSSNIEHHQAHILAVENQIVEHLFHSPPPSNTPPLCDKDQDHSIFATNHPSARPSLHTSISTVTTALFIDIAPSVPQIATAMTVPGAGSLVEQQDNLSAKPSPTSLPVTEKNEGEDSVNKKYQTRPNRNSQVRSTRLHHHSILSYNHLHHPNPSHIFHSPILHFQLHQPTTVQCVKHNLLTIQILSTQIPLH